ncbi:MAG: tail fiber domain-containing protein [Bacteroidota bacterium]
MRSYFTSKPGFAILVFLCCFFAVISSANAQAYLSVQGILTKTDGTAVDDDVYTLKFILWKSETGTSAAEKAWEESISGVETVGGVYSVVLGNNGTALTAAFDQVYWLGVSINGGQELSPRPLLTHSPYALSLLGQSNTFPSTGKVKADWITAKSGGPGVGGYSFQTGGATDGGLFSTTAGRVSLYTNNTERLKVETNVTVSAPLVATGISNLQGKVTLGTDLATDGQVFIKSDKGYCFKKNDGTEDASGGLFRYYVNDGSVLLKGGSPNTNITITADQIYFSGINAGGGTYPLKWNNQTGAVTYDNSSRRYKENITPLTDDFSLILKSKPKRYTRPGNPNNWELGYIAEEMDSIGLHNLVLYENDGKVVGGFNYEKMILYVTEVLKTQDAAIKELKAQNANLTAELSALKQNEKPASVPEKTSAALSNELEQRLNDMSKRLQELEAALGKR